jgi:hypothetical protein
MYTGARSTRSSLESGRAGDGGGGIGLAEASHVRKDDSMKTDDENSQLRIWTWELILFLRHVLSSTPLGNLCAQVDVVNTMPFCQRSSLPKLQFPSRRLDSPLCDSPVQRLRLTHRVSRPRVERHSARRI